MEKLSRVLLSILKIKPRRDDDFTDMLSRKYTVLLLMFFAFIVSTKHFVGEPISCWCPAHFTASHRSYTNSICWVSNTYYVPFDRRIPPDSEQDWEKMRMISYYQWVPLVLMGQGLLFHVPWLCWRFLNLRSGIDLKALYEAGMVCQHASHAEVREKTIKYMVNVIDRYLLHQRDYRQACCVRIKQELAKWCFLVGGKRHGNYLTVTYLIVKFLYAVNVVGQLFLMDIFLGVEYHMYGAYIIARLMRGEDWTAIDRFPRVTLCNFEIRHQSRIHDYVVQCALTINLFNEKIFIIMWFWFFLVGVLTGFSFVKWIFRSFYWPGQINYVKKHLRALNATRRPKPTSSKFTQYYLRRDGLFIIRMMAINISEMVAAETLVGLWESYGPEKRLVSENPAKSRSLVKSGETPHSAAQGTNVEVV